MIKVYDLMLTMNLQIQVSFLINPRYSNWIVLAYEDTRNILICLLKKITNPKLQHDFKRSLVLLLYLSFEPWNFSMCVRRYSSI